MNKIIVPLALLASSFTLPAVANPGKVMPSTSATHLGQVDQSQTNVTTQSSQGQFDQFGSQVNIQNNRTADPIYTTFGTQRCPRPSLYFEGGHNVNWGGYNAHNSSLTIGGNIPLGDGGCGERVKMTFCMNIWKGGYTTDECDNSGLRKIVSNPVPQPEPEPVRNDPEPEPQLQSIPDRETTDEAIPALY